MKQLSQINCFKSIEELNNQLKRISNHRRVVFFKDSEVDRIYGNELPKADFLIESGEQSKSFDTIRDIISQLTMMNLGRDTLFMAIGGGVTSDVVGFIASIFKRGVPLIVVPTTLLSQVDASIGGKNGINIGGYKNVVGTIYQPDAIYFCMEFIKTLPLREYLCGVSELLKTYILCDEKRYYNSVNLLKKLKGPQALSIPENVPRMEKIVLDAAKIKSRIVIEDPNDKGVRNTLNLGHTFGHAIECCSQGEIRHGEAVAIGMIMSAELSNKLNYLPLRMLHRLKDDFVKLGLPISTDIPIEKLIYTIKNDKKISNNHLKFIMIEKIGKVAILVMDLDTLRIL